jgi:hypothetical protein
MRQCRVYRGCEEPRGGVINRRRVRAQFVLDIPHGVRYLSGDTEDTADIRADSRQTRQTRGRIIRKSYLNGID